MMFADIENGPVNTKEIALLDKISIYLRKKILFIDFKNVEISARQLSLLSMTGQEVKSIPVDKAKMKIKLNGINTGAYMFNIHHNEGIITGEISVN